MVGLIYDEVGKVRLAIDTPDPKAMAAGLELCQARPVTNSINNDPRLRRSIIKARVARKCLNLKRGNSIHLAIPSLQGVDWQFIHGFLEREFLD